MNLEKLNICGNNTISSIPYMNLKILNIRGCNTISVIPNMDLKNCVLMVKILYLLYLI
jgi:hypothetical protein